MIAQNGKSTIELIGTWLGVLVSVITLGLVVWRGGEMSHTLLTDSKRLDHLEQFGSASLRMHTERAAVELGAMEKRLAVVESAMTAITEMRVDIREIKTRLQFLDPSTATHQPAPQAKP